METVLLPPVSRISEQPATQIRRLDSSPALRQTASIPGGGCVTGGRPGLQNRACGTNPVAGGFDSHTLPPGHLISMT